GDRISLCFRNGVKHQARSISESSSLESFLVKTHKSSYRAGASSADLEWQPRKRSGLPYNYFVGTMINHAQPARKQRPPMGVIAPSQRKFASAIKYRLPLKRRIPAKSSHHAPRLIV